MVSARYNRSAIYTWYDLNKEQQRKLRTVYGMHIKDSQFVFHNVNERTDILPLSMFMRFDNKNSLWHGYYGTSYFSCYFIRFNHSNDEALIAERYS